ncbi:Auxin-responsive protein IAA18 [Triticum urartu]|uniref:Auxin-responsive protein n=1 Tax=Triticum urartu TaxID=4572 RepID=M8AQB0_TRIUA|nr:Auxin-responsive protein IAA18 [Triticum urartu]
MAAACRPALPRCIICDGSEPIIINTKIPRFVFREQHVACEANKYTRTVHIKNTVVPPWHDRKKRATVYNRGRPCPVQGASPFTTPALAQKGGKGTGQLEQPQRAADADADAVRGLAITSSSSPSRPRPGLLRLQPCCSCPTPVSGAARTTTGAKRGFFDAVGAKPQGYDRRQQEDREGRAPVHSSRDPPGRAAVVPVVGWPPVRSFRRNLTNGTSSKQQSPERQNVEATDRAKPVCKKKPLIKINMDGIPIGRKVDLASCDNYHKLSSAVEELFRGFLEAQQDLSCDESGVRGAEEKLFSGLLDGTGEYALVYEDDEGDRMLVGDIPWSVFVSTAKRLRVMRRSELPQRMLLADSTFGPSTSKQDNLHLQLLKPDKEHAPEKVKATGVPGKIELVHV